MGCRGGLVGFQSEAGEREALVAIKRAVARGDFSQQPCKVGFAEKLSVPGRLENDAEPSGWLL